MYKNVFWKKGLVLIIIMLFICMTIVPSTAINIELEKSSTMTYNGNTLYVGGSGPGNYTTIQSAIDDANSGDTVFVYDDSSPYYENVYVNQSIYLKGEDKNTTVIEGQSLWNMAVVQIKADSTSIQGFTIKGSYYGVQTFSHNTTIKENIIRYNSAGIQIGIEYEYGSNNNLIERNIIEDNDCGIILDGSSDNNIIFHNIILSNQYHGVFFRYGDCNDNIVTYNIISSNGQIGIWVDNANFNIIQHNKIIDNRDGISISSSNHNQVLENNIYDNKHDAGLDGFLRDLKNDNWLKNNIFDSNYWGRARYFPKPILAVCSIYVIPFFLIAFDMNPAQEPYDI